MSVTPYHRAIDDLFGDFYSMMPSFEDVNKGFKNHSLIRFPKYNVEAYPDRYEYAFDVPGVRKEDLTISETNGVVTLKGTRSQEVKDEKPNYKYYESCYGSFSRSFTVEEDGMADEMQASLNDGVLKLTVPRNPKMNPRERRISIS